MPTRPYVLISCAMSADGRIDDTSPVRLLLSGPDDLDRVDELRASADAILVGANTVRRDNPRLLIRSPRRRAARVAAGLPAHPARVTVTASGELSPSAHFFADPDPGPGPEPAAAAPAAAGRGRAAARLLRQPRGPGCRREAGGPGRCHRRR